MEIKDRDVQLPGRKKITKLSVDPNNTDIIYANLERSEGEIYEEGTEINAELLKKANWRDDTSVSFAARTDNNLPTAKNGETQVVTKANGETWMIPPANIGQSFQLGQSASAIIDVDFNPATGIITIAKLMFGQSASAAIDVDFNSATGIVSITKLI